MNKVRESNPHSDLLSLRSEGEEPNILAASVVFLPFSVTWDSSTSHIQEDFMEIRVIAVFPVSDHQISPGRFKSFQLSLFLPFIAELFIIIHHKRLRILMFLFVFCFFFRTFDFLLNLVIFSQSMFSDFFFCSGIKEFRLFPKLDTFQIQMSNRSE